MRRSHAKSMSSKGDIHGIGSGFRRGLLTGGVRGEGGGGYCRKKLEGVTGGDREIARELSQSKSGLILFLDYNLHKSNLFLSLKPSEKKSKSLKIYALDLQ